MLNHLLAVMIELGSLSLFLSGFFLPELRRKPDLAWSGVGFLYALLLWSEGSNTSGGALLGHMASVALILWFGGQTLQQRREFAAPDTQTSIPHSFETLIPFLKTGWGRMAIAYGEASDWVKAKLGQDDGLIAPEDLTPQPQVTNEAEDEWDTDANSDSETTDGIVTKSSESLIAEPTPELPLVEAPTGTSAVVSEESETEISGISTEVVEPDELREIEDSPTAIAAPLSISENNSAEAEESAETALTPTAAEPISERTEANPTVSPEPSATSSIHSPEDDETWPPPEPEA